MELHRGEIFIAVTVLVLNRFEQKVIITRNNDRDLNEYASVSILQTYPFSPTFTQSRNTTKRFQDFLGSKLFPVIRALYGKCIRHR